MKIAILGGGVAGISTAIALKLKGFEVSVYERHAGETGIGAGIVIWPNAAFVVDQLGVLDAMKAVSGYPARMQRLSSSGEDLGAIDITVINRQMGYPSLSILRSDFQRILLDRLINLGITVQYGHAVQHIADGLVTMQNGLQISADVLIGADGRMASVARRYIHGNNTPVYQGFINWIGVYQSSRPIFPELAIRDYWGMGERFGIVPVSASSAYWAGAIASEGIGERNPAVYKTELQQHFGSWPAPIAEVIAGSDSARINKIYVHDHDPAVLWHKDRLIMIGDAAHASLPTSGQGACQALEDAWHLANCLAAGADDLTGAYTRFTAMRLAKTAGITMAGRGLARSLFNTDPVQCQARNLASKASDFAAIAAAMARGWSQQLPLPA
ncbi:FAD-dependent urate hydroxylase [Andreprevotia sp. IGB-42]|uniref:FAD-dependent monooxygenase n=1 Tax=Andreprevotia sp. IGB-42 TaxID=2497473 RepID=UPI001359A2B8|nr:FAD-dependent monooxygenase [Andreprevotia sp. IGB-42]KAF0811709.1 FAD-dependent urate hydroxylase [Andreprevotia sp. IGB-42]